jgi:hypothetical protein
MLESRHGDQRARNNEDGDGEAAVIPRLRQKASAEMRYRKSQASVHNEINSEGKEHEVHAPALCPCMSAYKRHIATGVVGKHEWLTSYQSYAKRPLNRPGWAEHGVIQRPE